MTKTTRTLMDDNAVRPKTFAVAHAYVENTCNHYCKYFTDPDQLQRSVMAKWFERNSDWQVPISWEAPLFAYVRLRAHGLNYEQKIAAMVSKKESKETVHHDDIPF